VVRDTSRPCVAVLEDVLTAELLALLSVVLLVLLTAVLPVVLLADWTADERLEARLSLAE
jgi:hypothetical protein